MGRGWKLPGAEVGGAILNSKNMLIKKVSIAR